MDIGKKSTKKQSASLREHMKTSYIHCTVWDGEGGGGGGEEGERWGCLTMLVSTALGKCKVSCLDLTYLKHTLFIPPHAVHNTYHLIAAS